MSLYNYFLTHPFGPGARTLEWIYLDRTGGAVIDLDGEPTYSADPSGTQLRIVALSNTTAEIWQLISGTHVSDPTNGWVRPLDFAATLNEKVWKRLLCFGTGGSGNVSEQEVWVIGEIPVGVIDGVNTVFFSANDFTKIAVRHNGLRQQEGADYVVTSAASIRFTHPPHTGDSVLFDYIEVIPSGNWTVGEIPYGVIDGVNQTFQTSINYTKIEVWLNGLRQKEGVDYAVEPPDLIYFFTAPLVGSVILVDYIQAIVSENWTIGEVPAGVIDGTNTDFTTVGAFVKLEVYHNRVRAQQDVDYTTIPPNRIRFLVAPSIGDTLLVDYTT